jgi:nicotinamide-nucleotide amidase
VKVEILATGDELMGGALVDTNSAWMMGRLWSLGLRAARVTLVGDVREDILAAIRESAGRAQVVVMGGGLGPTGDDLTAECLAEAMGAPLEMHAPTLEAIRERFRRAGREMTANNERQARVPRGAGAIANPNGSAPGLRARLGSAEIFCLPGPPEELRPMFEAEVMRFLKAHTASPPGYRVVKLMGVPESHADQRMAPLTQRPDLADVRFGYRAHWPEVEVKWTVPGLAAEARADRILAEVRAIFGDAIFGEGEDADLARLVVERLLARGARLGLAESCTGGLLSELLTRVPGVSGTLDLGVVAYADGAKTALLGVPPELVASHGAVSEPVARAMAEGSRERVRSIWGEEPPGGIFGVGITGVAGPGGGSEEKPVGTVHLALCGPGGTRHALKRFGGDRRRIRRLAAFEALDMLRRSIVDS